MMVQEASEAMGQRQSSAAKRRRYGKESVREPWARAAGALGVTAGRVGQSDFQWGPTHGTPLRRNPGLRAFLGPVARFPALVASSWVRRFWRNPWQLWFRHLEVLVCWRCGWGLCHSGDKELQLRKKLVLSCLYSIIVHLEGEVH